MTLIPPPPTTTSEKLDAIVKYARLVWGVLLFIVMATAYATTTLGTIQSRVENIDTNGSRSLQEHTRDASARWERIDRSLARIEGKLGIE